MRSAPPRRPNPPRRLSASSRPRVALLLLGLILCALLILRQRAQVSGESTGRRVTGQSTPTARLDPAGGAARQGEFRLLAVTREQGNVFFPPDGARVFPAFSLTTPGGTGVWIRVTGGLGAKMEPLLPDEHRFQVGANWLVTSVPPGFDFSSPVGEWRMADGVTPVPPGHEPYSLALVREQSTAPAEARNALLLIPPGLQNKFQVTARPLSRAMKPLGLPVRMVWQPAGEDAMFVQIPAGYSIQTRAFEIVVTRQGVGGQTARWRVRDMPSVTPSSGPAPELAAKPQTVGKLAIAASAEESPDLWSAGGLWEHFPVAAKGDPPVNLDGHGWSGVPTLRCRLQVTPVSDMPPGEHWEIVVSEAIPEWSAPTNTVSVNNSFNRLGPRPTFITLRPAEAADPLSGPAIQEMTCGVAYPGQQRYVRLRTNVVRYATRVEPVVFHDADIVADKATPDGRLVWSHPQTQVTPSGLKITVLNARRPSTVALNDEFPDSPAISNSWFYRRLRPGGRAAPGSVELRLAWTAPNRLTRLAPPPGARGHQYQPWCLSVGGEWKAVGGPQPGRWTGMWLPGAPPPGPPRAAPAAPVGLGSAFGSAGASLRAARRPDVLTPLLHQSYVPVALRIAPVGTPTSSSHVDSLTVLVRTRVEMERRSVTLTVPVSPAPARSKPTFEASAGRG